MHTLRQIRQLLAEAGASPRRRLGQHFLIDANLMGKLLELADLGGRETVLEVGAGTGSLTEELVERAGRVVAVELDAGLADVLRRRLGERTNLTVVAGDVLAGKHALAPAVLDALADASRPGVHLVSNLPYHIAVPVVLNALWCSWRAAAAGGTDAVRFDRLTFTVQAELADRLTAAPGGGDYGPAAVTVALLARATPGRAIGPKAFWPRPKVTSRMLRLDFDAEAAATLRDAGTLSAVLAGTFGHRRKTIANACRARDFPIPPPAFLDALAAAGVDRGARPHQVRPSEFRTVANVLSERQSA